MFARKRQVHFVFAPEFRESGSTVMRGFQLADHVRQQYGSRLDVRCSPLSSRFRSSILFLTKGAVKRSSPESLEALKSAGNTLLFDLVDEAPPAGLLDFADRVVASSITAFRAYSRDLPSTEVVLVNHHVDPRLGGIDRNVPRSSKAGYFGETVNAVLTDRIRTVVDPVHIDTSTQRDDSWLRALPAYDLHYAVRNERELDQFKPFLKGFTAAHCSANIVIQRSQTEAVEWLGGDYPYLIDDAASEEEIVGTVERALAERGSASWNDALARMQDIRERTAPTRIAHEFLRAIA